jgi:hypothetical protein
MTQPGVSTPGDIAPQRRALKGRKKTTLKSTRFALKTEKMFVVDARDGMQKAITLLKRS